MAALGYVVLCGVARLGYRVLLYPVPHDPPFVPPAGAKLLTIHADDGALVVAAQFPPPDDHARTVVVFHGNGETMGGRVELAEDLRARGLGVVLAEFRGYGLATSSGPPDEAGLYRDAAAILDELERQGIGPQRVALIGISLGTGVAAEMAARGRAASLILVSPYTSITAMAAGVVPFLPAACLCPDKFDTLSKAPRLRVPTLVIHGDADEVVPFAMGQEVAAAIPGAALRVVRGGHHNDLFLKARAELEEAIADEARR
jgi:alpha-beta hydrolase superfamily lysophospholipase